METVIRELPIMFSAPMVRALFAGTKTQTRRMHDKPRYRVGDHLWVRESWRALECFDREPPRDIPEGQFIRYVADGIMGK